MILNRRLGVLAAAGVLAFAVPALAKPMPPTHPTHPTHPAHPNKSGHPGSNKCTPHNVAYISGGSLMTWSATAGSDGRYTGTITVAVTRTNHHAKGDKGTTVTYTLTDTRVRFGDGANPPAAGDRVKVIGKITAVAKKCTDQSGAGTITVRRVIVRVPKAH